MIIIKSKRLIGKYTQVFKTDIGKDGTVEIVGIITGCSDELGYDTLGIYTPEKAGKVMEDIEYHIQSVYASRLNNIIADIVFKMPEDIQEKRGE